MNHMLKAGISEDEESFELLKHLGTGGFAHTYFAKVLDEDLREEFGSSEVALKIPLSKQKERALKVELNLFITLNARMKDPSAVNIVPFLGFAVFKGQLVMAMRFLPNGSLRHLIGGFGRRKNITLEQAIRIAADTLKGLQFVHSEHVLHRDVKPENVLMDGETAKIADFGIGRMLDSNELASTTTGTIYYMAPEILGAEGASFPADIWSMGVLIYEMVTGRLPFGDKETPMGTMADLIRRGSHIPACDVNGDIPPGLSKVIDRTLSKQPNKRPTAQELHDALLESMKKPDELECEIAPIRELMNCSDASTEVESKLRHIVRKHSQNPKSYHYLGEFYNRCQRHSDALDAFQKGLQFDPRNAVLHWDCALAANKLGRTQDAARLLQKAIALDLDPNLKRAAKALLRALGGGAE